MAVSPDDPSGYQRLIADEGRRVIRWLLAFEVVGIISLMLNFDRWSVYRWSFVIFVQLAFIMVRKYFQTRTLGYGYIADRDRDAIIETLVAFAVITLFVLTQSQFQFWFAQEPFCYRYCGR